MSMPGGHGCCHGGDAGGRLVMRAVGSCCHIESAQRDMTSIDAVQLPQPTATVVDRLAPGDDAVSSRSAAPSFVPSPPGRILRI